MSELHDDTAESLAQKEPKVEEKYNAVRGDPKEDPQQGDVIKREAVTPDKEEKSDPEGEGGCCPRGEGVERGDFALSDKRRPEGDSGEGTEKEESIADKEESPLEDEGKCIKKEDFTPDNEERPEVGLDINPPANDNDGETEFAAQAKMQAEASMDLDVRVEDLVSENPPVDPKALANNNDIVAGVHEAVHETNDNNIGKDINIGSNEGDPLKDGVKNEYIVPNNEARTHEDLGTNPPSEERPEANFHATPPADDGEAEADGAIDRMVEDLVNESPMLESKLDGFRHVEDEVGNATEIVAGVNDHYKESMNESDNRGSVSEGEDDEASEHSSLRHQYPPPPPGYEHYPPPPGYYPYPPHYPPHPHYGYPPPPPGYYPPPPGYYPPPGHPHLPPTHQHPAPPGERDPTTGNFIYGGPPPTAAAPAKRSRMRIKTPQDIMNRKIRKNAQSRSRAARLREKVDSIRTKAEELKTDEEASLHQTFEERRARKNNRSRERALEKKAELERITAKPESERTKEEIETLNIAMTAKRRKNEGDRLRRERLKKMGLKVKPPGVSVRGRPRKPLSGEHPVMPYGNPVPFPPVGPPIPPPMPPHGGSDTFQYPPPAIPQSYTPMYYNEPPQMKEENEDKEGGANNEEGGPILDDRPGSARSTNTEQEVSELLLQDHGGGVEEHTVDVGMKDAPHTVG
eukprot:CAMPEP_0172569864 /NCGR_PEP_ID=MMETSP1067-20121228/125258_1 /TAXON_ID=265564 ORGANISM="Thalassiosira punctigera, Strain Tpunct2005C2" /NCGR_SAMPLE_ID=MMETSP1067 /ASSEMBLY_ACC=CAM_ASM_000444 /LENGTH=686 /DNA_ID=CAMNT_0013361799 /DNA_START=42 /DNA_END=2105 /DNA_ORIENTATION=-